MESVEDIPAASILYGLPWDWETYGEYLASLSRIKTGVNVGGMVGHCAVRYHAMGERGSTTWLRAQTTSRASAISWTKR